MSDVEHKKSFRVLSCTRRKQTRQECGEACPLSASASPPTVSTRMPRHKVRPTYSRTHAPEPPSERGGKFKVIEILRAICQSVSTCRALFAVSVTFIRQKQAERCRAETVNNSLQVKSIYSFFMIVSPGFLLVIAQFGKTITLLLHYLHP